MSSQELPSASGADGQSVFSLFSYSGQQDADTLSQATAARHSRKLHNKGNHANIQQVITGSELIVPTSDSEPSSPSIPRALTPESARKMRGIPSESTKLVNPVVGADQGLESNQGHARRYSVQHSDNPEDTFDTDKVLTRFNSSVFLTSRQRRFLGKGSSSDTELDEPELTSYLGKLTRRQSSPDLTSDNISNIVDKMGTDTNSRPTTPQPPATGGFLSRYLGRGQSLQNISQSVKDEDKTLNKAGSAVDIKTPVTTTKSTETMSTTTKSAGFGILSRTRQFGAWFMNTPESQQLNITAQDLNAVAPTTF